MCMSYMKAQHATHSLPEHLQLYSEIINVKAHSAMHTLPLQNICNLSVQSINIAELGEPGPGIAQVQSE